MLNSGVCRRIDRARPVARCDEILHHHSRCTRTRKARTFRRSQDEKLPHNDHADMVDAQYRLLSEGLSIRHVRLIIGNSMGGMNCSGFGRKISRSTWMPWCRWPRSRRRWRAVRMLRRMMLETIRMHRLQQRHEHHPTALHEVCQRILRHCHGRRHAPSTTGWR